MRTKFACAIGESGAQRGQLCAGNCTEDLKFHGHSFERGFWTKN